LGSVHRAFQYHIRASCPTTHTYDCAVCVQRTEVIQGTPGCERGITSC
jgi:hypothetical protein